MSQLEMRIFRKREARIGPNEAPQGPQGQTITFPVHIAKETVPKGEPCGLLVEGTPTTSPVIINIEEASAASRARPRLRVGMRILAVNGKRMLGASAIASAIRASEGAVTIEAEGEASKGSSGEWGRKFKAIQKRGDSFASSRHSIAASSPSRHAPASSVSSPGRSSGRLRLNPPVAHEEDALLLDRNSEDALDDEAIRPIASTFAIKIWLPEGTWSLGVPLSECVGAHA